MKDSNYEVWQDGKPLVEVFPEDLLILKNCTMLPDDVERLNDARVLLISGDVEVVVVRKWKDGQIKLIER